MGLFQALVGGPTEGKVVDASALSWTSLGLRPSKAGVSVNLSSALRVSTVLACCRVLAEGIAQLPLKLMQEKDDGSKVMAKTHPTYRVLYRTPNEWMTSFEFRESAMYHALLAKGAFAIKNVVGGKVVELLPVLPQCVTIRQSKAWEVTYHISDGHGPTMDFRRDQVFHLRGPSWDTVNGLEMINEAREAIGLAIATEETQARLHQNGVRPGGLVSIDGSLKDGARERLKEQINKIHQGVENVGKLIFLDQGGKFEPFNLSGVDSQHLETRKHQVEEIARMFRVFPQMIGYADKTATYASAEQFFIAHVIHSLGPWIERWEQAIYRDLISDNTREDYYAKFFVQGLLRGDAVSRSQFYKSAIADGYMTRNEVRALEDLNPLPGLDVPLMPLNMTDGSKSPAPPQPKTTPNASALASQMGGGDTGSADQESEAD